MKFPFGPVVVTRNITIHIWYRPYLVVEKNSFSIFQSNKFRVFCRWQPDWDISKLFWFVIKMLYLPVWTKQPVKQKCTRAVLNYYLGRVENAFSDSNELMHIVRNGNMLLSFHHKIFFHKYVNNKNFHCCAPSNWIDRNERKDSRFYYPRSNFADRYHWYFQPQKYFWHLS